MAKIILLCGRVCSGKSTYAKKLMKEIHAVRLDPDEIMLKIHGEHTGKRHEEILQSTLELLYEKAVETYYNDVNVIIDFGFWQRKYREEANLYFKKQNIRPEWHFIDVDESTWKERIKKRNAAVKAGSEASYYIDDIIIAKFTNQKDIPEKDEYDIRYTL